MGTQLNEFFADRRFTFCILYCIFGFYIFIFFLQRDPKLIKISRNAPLNFHPASRAYKNGGHQAHMWDHIPTAAKQIIITDLFNHLPNIAGGRQLVICF